MIRISALSLGAALVLVASTGFAAAVEGEVDAATTDSYVRVGDKVLKTGLGECTHTGNFSDSDVINVCEGIVDEPVEEIVKAEPKAVAPAPQKAVIDTREISELAFFDFDSSELNANGVAAMADLEAKVAEYKGISSIKVIGHSDSQGAEEYNQALSERRAQTIATALAKRYPDAAMNVVGMGESAPIASNDTAEGRKRNRRVEIEVTASRMTFE